MSTHNGGNGLLDSKLSPDAFMVDPAVVPYGARGVMAGLRVVMPSINCDEARDDSRDLKDWVEKI